MSNQKTIRSKDLYELLEKQHYRCALTGRELVPEITDAEHIIPLDAGGMHDIDNIYLIVRDAARLKRYLTEEALLKLCYDIIVTKGQDYGYQASKLS